MNDEIRDRWLRALAGLRVARSGGERKVHKPLLVLWLIARASRRESREVRFDEVAGPLESLLQAFGGPNQGKSTAALPFWHLQSDGIWEVRFSSGFTPPIG